MQKKTSKEPSFEAALEKLEGIVETMEDGRIPLEELLSKFEEGSALLKVCERRLRDAEFKIEQLKKDRTKTSLEPFAESTPEEPAS